MTPGGKSICKLPRPTGEFDKAAMFGGGLSLLGGGGEVGGSVGAVLHFSLPHTL